MSSYGSVLVAGLGVTGRDVATYLLGRARAITVYGGASSTQGAAAHALSDHGINVVCGTDEIEGEYDLAVISPGIPEHSTFAQNIRLHAAETIGEIEFAWRVSPERWVGITGTNGKTTTTTLTRDLFCAAGQTAEAVGNIGASATSAVSDRESDSWLIAELSSYQLASTSRLHPRVAAILNVTPDHLSWHGSMQAYVAAKERIFANLDSQDLAIVSIDDEWCRGIAQRLDDRHIAVCRVSLAGEVDSPHAAFVRNGVLTLRLDGVDHSLIDVRELGIRGSHNVQNALVASACAAACKVSDAVISEVLARFTGLEHRIEPCGSMNGISFVNDSKATNVASTLAALTSFSPGTVVLLLGGTDKGTDLEELAHSVVERCCAVVCFGEAGPRMSAAIRSVAKGKSLQIIDASHLADATAVATRVARRGDTVLLSPACASFDEFSGFEERGRAFKALLGLPSYSGEVT